MTKRKSTYWKKRFSDLEASQHHYAEQTFHDVQIPFDKAQAQIQAQIESWYGRYATNNGITMAEARKQLSAAELKELKWDVQAYIKAGQENAIDGRWMKELENASARFHISRLEALKLRTQQQLELAFGNQTDSVDSMMKAMYQSGYYHTCFEVQKGFNIGWEIGEIDDKKLQRVISKPWAADGKNFSDRIWSQKTQMVNSLHQQLTRTIIQGKAPDEAIKELSKYVADKTKNAKVAAGRLVMTESAFISSAAQEQAFKDLDVEEFEIVATLDSHTSEICQDMDGQHFPMKDFEPGVTAPPFHVYCRSCTCPYFNDEWSGGERAARDEDGKTYYVPSNMTYKDWSESFVQGKTEDLKPADPKITKEEMTSQMQDLEKQFSDMTEGYSYDDFMKDFGSIEEGFEGSTIEEITKAKNIADQIQSLRSDLGIEKTSVVDSIVRTKEESIEAFENLGIKFKDKSSGGIPDSTISKFVDFVSDFEMEHTAYFGTNQLQLKSISVIDDLTENGKKAADAYYSKTQSINLMQKSIMQPPTSKLITYSKSDDYQIHFLAHEYGHYVADTLKKNIGVSDYDVVQNALLRYFKDDIFKANPRNLVDVIGSYGSKNAQEAFAEAFAEAYTCEEPGEFAKIFKEELEKLLKMHK